MGRWNYRIGTRLESLPTGDKLRTFSIVSCYYGKDMKPDGWGESKNLVQEEHLRGSHRLMAGAFKKPTLDLDNFPKTYRKK